MKSRSYTSSFRKSLALGAVVVFAAHVLLAMGHFPSPTLFTQSRVSQRLEDIDRYARKKGEIDIVIAGFSRSVDGVDPAVIEELTGESCFNLGFASFDLLSQAMLLRDYVIPRWKPSTVLWGLPFQCRGQFRDNFRIVESDGFSIQRWPYGHRLVELAGDLFYYQRRPLSDWWLAIRNRRDDRYAENGFRSSSVRWSEIRSTGRKGPRFDLQEKPDLPWQSKLIPPPVDRQRVKDEDEAPYSEERVYRAFEDVLAVARDNAVRVIAFTVPVTFERYENEARWMKWGRKRRYADRMNGIMQRHGVPCADYRWYPAISKDHGLFYNSSHLNRYGAEVFTRVLHEKCLAEDGVIPEKRRGLFSRSEYAVIGKTPSGRRFVRSEKRGK